MSLRYTEADQPVLKSITCLIRAKEKVPNRHILWLSVNNASDLVEISNLFYNWTDWYRWPDWGWKIVIDRFFVSTGGTKWTNYYRWHRQQVYWSS